MIHSCSLCGGRPLRVMNERDPGNGMTSYYYFFGVYAQCEKCGRCTKQVFDERMSIDEMSRQACIAWNRANPLPAPPVAGGK